MKDLVAPAGVDADCNQLNTPHLILHNKKSPSLEPVFSLFWATVETWWHNMVESVEKDALPLSTDYNLYQK